ncbi:hypothetical protein [Quadrisphaera setariae]|nr:hypothetical protein [Quadrisphaera setariae]
MLSRRGLLTGGLTLTAGSALAACAAPASRAASASPPGSAPPGGDPPLLMVIRHAEKPPSSGAPHGVLPSGEQDGESLTTTGWARAGALVGLFEPVDAEGPAALRAGLSRPAVLVAADPSRGSRRPFQTLTPLAARLGLDVQTSFAKGQEAALASSLRDVRSPTLVAWEHQAIPAIVADFGPVAPAPPSSWPGDRFDLVWCFSRTDDDGWRFSQVPQLLLAGDSAQLP